MSRRSPSRSARLHRSDLAVPATAERFRAAAAGFGDVVWLDLGDAVASRLRAVGAV